MHALRAFYCHEAKTGCTQHTYIPFYFLSFQLFSVLVCDYLVDINRYYIAVFLLFLLLRGMQSFDAQADLLVRFVEINYRTSEGFSMCSFAIWET